MFLCNSQGQFGPKRKPQAILHLPPKRAKTHFLCPRFPTLRGPALSMDLITPPDPGAKDPGVANFEFLQNEGDKGDEPDEVFTMSRSRMP